jgi:ABC-2 type transport system permease protein
MIGFWTLIKRETMRFFQVPNNTILPVVVSTVLYFIIFGVALGQRIAEGDPKAYMQFLIPGLIMMNMINGAFSNPSGSLFVSRLLGYINDVLLSSLSYLEIVFSYIIGGVIRGLTLGLATWAIGLFFAPVGVMHIGWFLLYSVLTCVVFACFGILIGLWAERNDTLNIPRNFIITPLVFLGGVFYSIEIVPEALRTFTIYNPLFYMVNGLRYSMTGVEEGSIVLGALMLVIMSTVLISICAYVFRIGWKMRS